MVQTDLEPTTVVINEVGEDPVMLGFMRGLVRSLQPNQELKMNLPTRDLAYQEFVKEPLDRFNNWVKDIGEKGLSMDTLGAINEKNRGGMIASIEHWATKIPSTGRDPEEAKKNLLATLDMLVSKWKEEGDLVEQAERFTERLKSEARPSFSLDRE
ncbi:hypothetical protein ACFL1A_03400 [Patescibacteria group bacterium]